MLDPIAIESCCLAKPSEPNNRPSNLDPEPRTSSVLRPQALSLSNRASLPIGPAIFAVVKLKLISAVAVLLPPGIPASDPPGFHRYSR